MQQSIQEYTEPSIGKKVWNVRQQLTSMIKFEIGKEIEVGEGEYHYWISCCHWWLKKGQGKDFADIVNSESSSASIANKISILEGKKLLNVAFHPENGGTFFDFEDDLFLQTEAYGGKDVMDQWYLFKRNEVLVIRSDGSCSIQDPNEH